MRLLVLIASLFCSIYHVHCQERTITIPATRQLFRDLNKQPIWLHPQFVPGIIHYKNGRQKKALLNYNIMFDDVYRQRRQGGKKFVASGRVRYVVLEKDTLHTGEFYHQVLAEYDRLTLVSRKVFSGLDLVGMVGSLSIYQTLFVVRPYSWRKTFTTEPLAFSLYEVWYLVDLKGVYYPFNPSIVVAAYPHLNSKVQRWLEQNYSPFKNKDDILHFLNAVLSKAP